MNKYWKNWLKGDPGRSGVAGLKGGNHESQKLDFKTNYVIDISIYLRESELAMLNPQHIDDAEDHV